MASSELGEHRGRSTAVDRRRFLAQASGAAGLLLAELAFPSTGSRTVLAASQGLDMDTLALPETLLYEADWSQENAGWSGGPDWKVGGGMLLSDGSLGSTWSYIAAPINVGVSDYAVEAQILSVRALHDFGVFLRRSSSGGYLAGPTWWDGLAIYASGGGGELKRGGVYHGGVWRTYRLEAQGNSLTLLLDGSVQVSVQATQLAG